MDSTDDAKAGAEAGADFSSHQDGNLSSQEEERYPLNVESRALSYLPPREDPEDDAQAGAEESSIAESDTGTSSDGRHNHPGTRGEASTSGPNDDQEGPSSILLAGNGHEIHPVVNAEEPSRRSMSRASRKNARVSFEDNVLSEPAVSASEIALPASAASSVLSGMMPAAAHGDSLEKLEAYGTEISRERPHAGMPHDRDCVASDARPLGQASTDNAIPSHSSSRMGDNSIAADQISLPATVASSNVSGDLYLGPNHAPVIPLGHSLDQLPTVLEGTPQPARKKKTALLNWIAGPSRPKKKPQKSRTPTSRSPDPPSTIAAETRDYRASIEELASHFPTFKNVATTGTRHDWSSRIVLYDLTENTQDEGINKYEPWPWEDNPDLPHFDEFYNTLRTIPDDCTQRLILVEDLSPALIDLLGATFQIPPHVFEEHLERSGYTGVVDDRDDAAAWHTRPSAHGYSSITWYRPVLPLVPITPRFHSKIIGEEALPRVQCPIVGCKKHDLWLASTANIWRHQLDLCTDPGLYYKNSQTRYPVGWEERATVWTQNSAECKFVIMLLDPLPMVAVEYQELAFVKKRRQRVIPTMANLWFRREELAAANRSAKRAHNDSHRHKHVHDWMEETIDLQEQAEHAVVGGESRSRTQRLSPNLGPSLMRADRTRVTGVDLNDTSTEFTPAPLRRRFTRPSKVRQGVVATYNRRANRPDSDLLSEEVEVGNLKIVDPADREVHQDFVIYEPIKARASSTAWMDETVLTYHMRTYIDSLQNPRSTLDEFDHFLMSGKGKNRTYDPFQALFRTIHDDSNSLVDIIRTSMQRIREGTLDEEFMQKRVRFWRSLLHRLSFHLGVLEQGLREFEQFIYEPEAHTAQPEIRSQAFSKDTQRTLRGCMDLIDRSSHSLLAEMQIADSRRGIAEAESVSKLTELAFVFIPLSFVASLFSMQVHELDGGVPAYQFALVAIAILIAAYAMRLSIRSARLIEYRDNLMRQVNEDSGLRPDEKLPTHKFLAWAGANIGSIVLKNSKNTAAVLAPLLVAMTVIAAVLSPIVLLWQRNINAGFSIAITVLMLLLDGVLVVPVAVNMSNAGLINFDPRDRIRRIQKAHERNRYRRQKERRRRRREAGLDPEAPYEESSFNSDPDLKRKTGSLGSSVTDEIWQRP